MSGRPLIAVYPDERWQEWVAIFRGCLSCEGNGHIVIGIRSKIEKIDDARYHLDSYHLGSYNYQKSSICIDYTSFPLAPH